MQVHMKFHFSVLDNTDETPVNLYFVKGFNELYSVSVDVVLFSSNMAPSKALVAGGYFMAKRMSNEISFSLSSFIICKKRKHELRVLESGIFFMYRIASKICNNGILSFVIVFFCFMKAIV